MQGSNPANKNTLSNTTIPFTKKALSAAITSGLLIAAPMYAQAASLRVFTDGSSVDEEIGGLGVSVELIIDEDTSLIETPCTVSGQLIISSGTATNGDDVTIPAPNFSIDFYGSEGASIEMVNVAINDDSLVEGDEDFTVSITNVVDSCSFYSGVDSTDELTMVITDNDDDTGNSETETPASRPVTNSKIVSSMGTLSLMGASTQTQNLSKQVRRLREGTRGNDLSGLKLNIDGETLTGNDLNKLFGAGAGDENITSDWGTFIGGSVRLGEQKNSESSSDFEFGISTLFVGVDYRINNEFIVGGVLGYTTSATDDENNSGETKLTGYSIGMLSSYYFEDKFYIDGIFSLGNSDYSTVRNIGTSSSPTYAYGETEGNELSVSLNTGYYFRRKQSFVQFFGAINYVEASIDGYNENLKSGTSTDLLSVNDQDAESLTTNIGIQIGKSFNTANAVLIPQTSLDWEHQYKDDGRVITGEYIGDPSSTTFSIDTGEQDRDYFNLGLTLSAVFKGGFSSFITVEKDLGRDEIDVYDISLGGRWEF